MNRGILSFGAYVPRRRLQRKAIHAANAWFAPGLATYAKGERAVANWDEDSITMAVEAARDALSGTERNTVDAVGFASTTHPFADRLNAGIVKEALILRDDVRAGDSGGSLRAGTTSLINALSGAGTHLCVASDFRRAQPGSEAEMLQGDGAAALIIGDGAPIAECIGTYSVTTDFVDHFRQSGAQFDYSWESRWVREVGYAGILGGAVKTALQRAGIEAQTIDLAVLPLTSPGAAQTVAKAAGIRPAAIVDPLGAQVGDTGAAHPLLVLISALERAKPGQRILVAGFGQGADVVILEATAAIAEKRQAAGIAGHLTARIADENYMRFLFHRGLLNYDRGMRAELDQKQPGTTLYRHRKATLGLVGSRSTKTGVVQFPRSEIGVDGDRGNAGGQEEYPLADKLARVVSFTADSLTYSPDPPTFYGTVDFDGGGRLVTEFAEVTEADVEVGRPMRMVFRIKAEDERRGFVKYFWKASPHMAAAAE